MRERITSIGWNGSTLVVAREGHGLVPGDEEALEVEHWQSNQLLKRFDVKRRVVSIDGSWMGLDMGGVMHDETLVAELSHPAHTIINRGDTALVGSWFHFTVLTKMASSGLLKLRAWSKKFQSTRMGLLF